ncbi:hypothetical protein [Microbacterium sp. SORGH_AS_0888]|uniref:hypothetical protein n=1 Tax=Microbacterium sp. SORGH_AS_0888 TaxID=3041791 RepID=UPI0027862B97|nr:hypothetical protein [Microbacterium sp. SORGH_AS_0888]MDQ1130908.1 hypothetical protein [Microbacterium sp. SORGH_AS_0888]
MLDTAINPMLDDDDEVTTEVVNPMLEDEEVSEPVGSTGRFTGLRLPTRPDVAAPVKPEAPVKVVREQPRVVAAPSLTVPAPKKKPHRLGGPVVKPENIGKEGYDSLGRKKTGSPRFKPTELDALFLAHLAKFRVAYAEDLAELAYAKVLPMNAATATPTLLSERAVTKRLERLRAKGYVGTKNDKRGKTVWGATQDGVEVARSFGLLAHENDAHPKSFTDMGWSPSDHFLQISRIAARFASPAGMFQDTLNVGPVDHSALVAEHQIGSAFARATDRWRALKGEGRELDYPAFRESVLAAAQKKVAEGRLAWNEMLAAYPVLWMIGNYGEEKQAHPCDFIVNREAQRTGRDSESIAVEVELSIKSWDEYVALLRSFAKELSTLAVFGYVAYLVPTNKTGRDIEKMLRAVDRSEDLGLFDSGRFLVLPIYNRDGSNLELRRKLGD